MAQCHLVLSGLTVTTVVGDEIPGAADAGVWPAMTTRAGTAVVVAKAKTATKRRDEWLMKRGIGQSFYVEVQPGRRFRH
jgi:succinyl-CoA synthetase alpha subunit